MAPAGRGGMFSTFLIIMEKKLIMQSAHAFFDPEFLLVNC